MKNNEEIIRLTLGWPYLAKGQLISKEKYGILDSSKTRTLGQFYVLTENCPVKQGMAILV